ncbi:MAG: RecX family transcriptional regulator [Anaerolineales bacterium]|nr:RecX family transcriptional regulator [Anaerolineales bacterium]MCB9128509.1 RecX family transcriptional regulator [Ardenticatenales bacterium]
MKRITRLAYQKRNKERVNVYLDDEFAFGLALAEAVSLKIGQLLSDEDIARLKRDDEYHKAYGRALDYLSRRPRSQYEIESYLRRKEISEAHIERIVERLTTLHYLDDFAFARYWIEQRESFRPKGARALRAELRQKRVDPAIIDQALNESALDEEEGAYQAAAKKRSRWEQIDDYWLFQKKAGAFLARRGYGWDVIRSVCQRLWNEQQHDN